MATQETIKQIRVSENGPLRDIEDATARQLITQLQSVLDALVGGDTTTAIETFQEVIDFLAGVTDSDTLIGKLNELRTLINGKVTAETGKGLSSNDYTTAEKTKLAGIATGAEVNVQSDWEQTNSSADDFIKNKPVLSDVATSGSYEDLNNKPTIPTALSGLSDDSTHRTVTDAEKSTWGGKQDALTYDNAPTENSNNMVKSGGIYIALQNLLSNITIGQNGNWYVGQTDTHIKAQGPKGDDGEDGTLTLQEGETPTLSIVADLNTDDDLSDNIKVLSAGMGKKLGIRTRLVLDEIDSEYNGTDNLPSVQDVGNGLTVHCSSDDKIRHYYVDNNSVDVISSDPDKEIIYCLAETDTLIRWDGTGWRILSSGGGGGITIQENGDYLDLVIGSSGGGGSIGLPKITITPNTLVFDSATSGQTKTIIVKAKNCTEGGTIVLTSGNSQFTLDENVISVDDAVEGVEITVTCNGTTEIATEITAYCQEDDATTSASVSYESPWAFTSADNAALCTALYNASLINSADGVLKSEVSNITALPADFMKGSTASSLDGIEKLTSLTTIGSKAFQDMSNLTGNVHIPSSVTSIESQAFSYNGSGIGYSVDSLGSITVLKSATFIYSKVKSVVIPPTCTSIENTVFYSCNLLKNITIEGTPTINKNGSFEGINSSAVFTCLSSTPPNLTVDIPNTTNMTLRVPADALSIYQNHAHWNKFGTIETIGDND